MPTINATWMTGYGWVIVLPDGRERICIDRAEALRVIDRDASGSAIRWIGATSHDAFPATPPSADDLARDGERPARRDARRTTGSPDVGVAIPTQSVRASG